jgi:endothelin-converting enzyme
VLYQDPIGTYNPLPLSNLSNSLHQIHFPTYFATFTPRTFPEKVIVTYPTYITSLSDILEDTAADVVEAYLVIRAALTLSPYLGTNTELWRAQRSLEELLTGVKKGVVGDRAEHCVERIEDALGFAAGRYFVNETFSEELKEQGTQVIKGQHILQRSWRIDLYLH